MRFPDIQQIEIFGFFVFVKIIDFVRQYFKLIYNITFKPRPTLRNLLKETTIHQQVSPLIFFFINIFLASILDENIITLYSIVDSTFKSKIGIWQISFTNVLEICLGTMLFILLFQYFEKNHSNYTRVNVDYLIRVIFYSSAIFVSFKIIIKIIQFCIFNFRYSILDYIHYSYNYTNIEKANLKNFIYAFTSFLPFIEIVIELLIFFWWIPLVIIGVNEKTKNYKQTIKNMAKTLLSFHFLQIFFQPGYQIIGKIISSILVIINIFTCNIWLEQPKYAVDTISAVLVNFNKEYPSERYSLKLLFLARNLFETYERQQGIFYEDEAFEKKATFIDIDSLRSELLSKVHYNLNTVKDSETHKKLVLINNLLYLSEGSGFTAYVFGEEKGTNPTDLNELSKLYFKLIP